MGNVQITFFFQKELVSHARINEPIQNTCSQFHEVVSPERQPTTPPTVSTPLISPLSTDYSMCDITPRKRKLVEKLRHSETVSASRKRKLVSLRKKMARKEKRISSMKAIIQDLKKKKLMEEECLDLLSKLGGPQEFYYRQYRKGSKKALPNRYSEGLQVFALSLHYYSPAAYKYVRKTFNTCLPHTRTISRWYQAVDGLPGFTSQAFSALHLKATASKEVIVCSLVMDEMAIRQHEEFVPSQGKTYGYVDMGTGANETTIAKALFFFIKLHKWQLENSCWKIPVGKFLIVLECLRKCHNARVMVVSLTFDGAPTNLTMAKHLGCNLEQL